MESKTCSKCKTTKSVELFNRRGAGRQPWCKACAHARRAEWARENPHKTKDYKAKYNHGLDGEEWNEYVRSTLEGQGWKCALCQQCLTLEMRTNVDHDHSCCPLGRSCKSCRRAILCTRCNIVLGYYEALREDEELRKRLEAYVVGKA